MIFLSYVSEDRERVAPFYRLLERNGFEPWMDCENLVGGQDWNYEIRVALDRADLIVVFISKNSVDKRGYAQREIKIALDKHEESVSGDLFVIPVQLDDGNYPQLLKGLHFIKGDLKELSDGLLRSVRRHYEASEDLANATQNDSSVSWSTEIKEMDYVGIPGYRTAVEKLRLTSEDYPEVYEISDHVNGIIAEFAMGCRERALQPDPNSFNLMQDKWRRTDTFDAVFTSIDVVGRALSVSYSLHWYGAGAAHPVHAPKIMSYLLQPIVYIKDVSTLFRDEGSLSKLRELVTKSLIDVLPEEPDLSWIDSGTREWKDFSNFSFAEDGVKFHFSSYQVASYAAGLPIAFVSYEDIAQLFNDNIAYAINRRL